MILSILVCLCLPIETLPSHCQPFPCSWTEQRRQKTSEEGVYSLRLLSSDKYGFREACAGSSSIDRRSRTLPFEQKKAGKPSLEPRNLCPDYAGGVRPSRITDRSPQPSDLGGTK